MNSPERFTRSFSRRYVVRPSSGIMDAKSPIQVQVIMQAQKDYPADFANCKDKVSTMRGGHMLHERSACMCVHVCACVFVCLRLQPPFFGTILYLL